MAKGDFYFPLFYTRLLTSTVGWSDAEFGAYLRLLIHQFDNGSIPSNLNELSRIAPSIKKHWPLISKKFHDNGEGNLINDVMDEIYHSIQKKKLKNSENGKTGGRPKNNRTVSEIKPNGFENETQTKAILIDNSKEIIVKEQTAIEPGVLKSNLFRSPNIPTKQQVWEAISSAGGTKEMAKSFWEKHEGTGWFINGSPIVNFASLAKRFVDTWKLNHSKKDIPEAPTVTYKTL